MAAFAIGALFGIIGFSVFLYGKKAGEPRPMVLGAALMVYPYLVRGALWTVLVGVGLLVGLWWP